MQLQKMLIEAEVAKSLGLSVITLRNWRCLGKGPRYVKMGRAVRYPIDEVQKFIAENIIEPRRKANEH